MVSVVQNIPQSLPEEQAIQLWLASLKNIRETDEIKAFSKACQLAKQYYVDQYVDDQQSLLISALSVADILQLLKMDKETLIATILQYSDLEQVNLAPHFDPTIIKLIKELQAIKKLTSSSINAETKIAHIENLRRMLLSISEDVRIILVLLAERLQLMRRLKYFGEQTQRQIARETQDIYAPLANRLGVWRLKWELEDLSLRYSNPTAYKTIATALSQKREARKDFISRFIKQLQYYLAPLKIEAEIKGRPKHIYSIWKKMQNKNLDFKEIYDVFAVRVMVGSIKQCYEILGVIHSHWRHIPDEFDDYIATPKGNHYQSLHTVVIGLEDQPVEIQIRTFDMHEHAERGVAAHWRYKENSGKNPELERRIEWMRNWLELKESATDDTFVENFSTNFESKKIYVLTPKGKIIELSKGATVLDFAYAIHTSIGHRCQGAKVDGRIMRLNETLKNGQTIEILTASKEQPKRDWLSTYLGYTKTNRARAAIRSWFKKQDYDFYLEEGKATLEREIKRLGAKKPDLKTLASQYNLKTADDLLAAIGRAEISPIQIANRALPVSNKPSLLETLNQHSSLTKPTYHGEIIVAGTDDIFSQVAGCCHPIPPDEIIGYITKGRGISIHRKNCTNIQHLAEAEQDRLIDASWNEAHQESYQVDLQVYAFDRRGLLKDILSLFISEQIDVLATKTYSDKKTGHANLFFSIELMHLEQLSALMDKLQQDPNIIEAKRVH